MEITQTQLAIYKYILILLSFAFLGCQTQPLIYFKPNTCTPENQTTFRKTFLEAQKKVLTCYQQYNQDDHPSMLNLLEKHTVTLECDNSHTKNYIARASLPTNTDSKSDFPRINVQNDFFEKDLDELRVPILAHEVVHWLGYRHNSGTDIAYITEFCCSPTQKQSKHVTNTACSMFSYNKKRRSTQPHIIKTSLYYLNQETKFI